MRITASRISALALVLIVLLLAGCSEQARDLAGPMNDETVEFTSAPVEGRYIVVLNQDNGLGKNPATTRSIAANVMRDVGLPETAIAASFGNALQGFTAEVDAAQAIELASHPGVAFVEQEQIFTMKRPPWEDPDPDPVDEVIPWGITRVGGAVDCSGKTAWVIDSGVDLDHPDLLVDASRGATFVVRTDTPDDDNGHGSHVAGTIAALDNEIGVIGVAAGATIVPVKVLDRRGSGSTTGVILGIEWVAANADPGDVANMSLGGGVSDALDLAVYNASMNGIYFALAAGNESDDANNHSPARVNGPYIFTVSAFGEGDVWASFSNYGNPPVDVAAPGVNIYSTYKSGGYTTMQGTSMASPHVAGLLVVTGGNLNYDGFVNGDPDGDPDPIGHN